MQTKKFWRAVILTALAAAVLLWIWHGSEFAPVHTPSLHTPRSAPAAPQALAATATSSTGTATDPSHGLRLQATIVYDDVQQSRALIRRPDGSRFYAIGENVAEDWQLAAIHTDRILLTHGKRQYPLYLSFEPSSAEPDSPRAQPSTTPQSTSPFGQDGTLRLSPHSRVRKKQLEQLAQLGLKPADLERLRQARTIRSSGTSEVTGQSDDWDMDPKTRLKHDEEWDDASAD